jgi:hypothetical protein
LTFEYDVKRPKKAFKVETPVSPTEAVLIEIFD